MNKLKMIFAGLVIAAAVVVGVNAKQAQAAEAVPNYSCDVAIVDGPSNNGLKVSADGKTVSATLIVTGSMANCDRYATISVWKSGTASGQPLSQQQFFGNTTVKLKAGTQTLTAQLPQCNYWQADLLGQRRPKSVHGDANYQYPQDLLANYKLGGRTCTPPPVDVCPNIAGMQTTVPAGYQKDASGNCVIIPGTPVTPTTPVTPVSATKNPEVISNTGPGAFAAIATAVTSAGSGIAHYVVRRKKLLV